jgi:hypothetical protein
MTSFAGPAQCSAGNWLFRKKLGDEDQLPTLSDKPGSLERPDLYGDPAYHGGYGFIGDFWAQLHVTLTAE